MNRLAIVALAAALLGLCGSAPQPSAISPALLAEFNNEAPAHASKFRRSNEDDGNPVTELIEDNSLLNPMEFLRQELGKVVHVVVGIVRDILSPSEDLLLHLQEFVRGIFDSLTSSGQIEGSTNDVDQPIEGSSSVRKRRQLLSGLEGLAGLGSLAGLGTLATVAASTLLPEPVKHPVQFLSNITFDIEDYTVNQLTEIVLGAARMILRFVSKTAIPWLHRTLNNLDETVPLPGPVHIFIQNFNVVYRVLNLLGYVG